MIAYTTQTMFAKGKQEPSRRWDGPAQDGNSLGWPLCTDNETEQPKTKVKLTLACLDASEGYSLNGSGDIPHLLISRKSNMAAIFNFLNQQSLAIRMSIRTSISNLTALA
jgi:hypothetical protein